MKDPKIVLYCQQGLGASLVLILSVYFFVWQMIQRKKDATTIWVPPKPAPALPFSPPPAPPKPEEFKKTTYEEHETSILKEVAQGALFSCGVAVFMSYKFNIHISCLMQAVMLPLGILDCLPAKKYLGLADKSKLLYGELLVDPTVSSSIKEKASETEKIENKKEANKVEEKKKNDEPIESID